MSESARGGTKCWLLVLAIAAAGCEPDPLGPFPNDAELSTLRALHSLPSKPPPDPTNKYADSVEAAALGKLFFHEPKFSACETISCASCHDGEGLAYPERVAEGCDGRQTMRNAPSLLNVGYGNLYMWDGKADRLWSQAMLPLLDENEMRSTPAKVMDVIASDPGFAGQYQEVFGKPVVESSPDEILVNFGKAVAAYERTLKRTEGEFDRKVRRFIAAAQAGEAESDPDYLGFKTFIRTGDCVSCHKGPALTDDRFHNVGVMDDSPGAGGAAVSIPMLWSSRFNARGDFSDAPNGDAANRLQNLRLQLEANPDEFEGAFKTPTLRNVALTAPYMHTGQLATLEDVIDFYDRGGDAEGTFNGVRASTVKPLELTAEEKDALLELLTSMTGDAP